METNGRMDTSDRNVLPANEVGKNPIPTLSLSSFERLGIAFWSMFTILYDINKTGSSFSMLQKPLL